MPGHEGQVIAQRYTLQKLVGRGGMGSVWQAHHDTLDCLVAVKLLNGEGSAELGARFRREARAAARLRSPNVVQVLDCGVEGGHLFIVMELLEGEDLRQRLHRVGRLNPEETYQITLAVKRVLRRAHAVGIVHRDLKPGNIFLCKHDDMEILKILDFGIAKSLFEQGITMPGMLLGTPGYTSPEQSLGSDGVDHRADLWALAVIVYRMLTGKLPFPGRNNLEILQASLRGSFEPPSSHERSLGPPVDAFFTRAFARSVEERFPDAVTFAQSLAVALDVDPRISSATLDMALDSEPKSSGSARGAEVRPSPVPAVSPTQLAVIADPAPLAAEQANVPQGVAGSSSVDAPRASSAEAPDGAQAHGASPIRLPNAPPRFGWSTVTTVALTLLAFLAFLAFSALFSELFGEG